MFQFVAAAEPWSVFNKRHERKRPPLVDVRSRSEFADGHALGAVSIPLDEIDIARLDATVGREAGRSQTLYLICEAGLRSGQAAHKSTRKGLRDVAIVAGGTQAWRADGLPITRPGNRLSAEQQLQPGIGAI